MICCEEELGDASNKGCHFLNLIFRDRLYQEVLNTEASLKQQQQQQNKTAIHVLCLFAKLTFESFSLQL